MSLYGASVEYGVHCLLHLVPAQEDSWPSVRDVAEFQGVPTAYVAKLFTRLQRAGLVRAAEGVGGGFRLARPAGEITVLDVVDALEDGKELFRCREVRRACALHEGEPPSWVTSGTCAVHAVMLAAEAAMRERLGSTTLEMLAGQVAQKAPEEFVAASRAWFGERRARRRPSRP